MPTNSNAGWIAYGKGDFQEAARQFEQLIAQNKNDLDSYYGLGLAQKRLKNTTKAIEAFTQAVTLAAAVEDGEKAGMLTRLLHGHLNFMKTGDWKIGDELWRK
jgi:tetratricopeptide (TPR) repeat protein